MVVLVLCTFCAVLAASALAAQPPSKRTALEPFRQARWEFGGELGRRIDRNIENWILRMPDANPGLLDMFRRRDRRQPFAEHTPWAGEFAGKLLVHACQLAMFSSQEKQNPYRYVKRLRNFLQG